MRLCLHPSLLAGVPFFSCDAPCAVGVYLESCVCVMHRNGANIQIKQHAVRHIRR